MKPIRIAVLALTILSLASVAGAQAAVVRMTVDAVSVKPSLATIVGFVTVTGVVQGEATPTSHDIIFTNGTVADQAPAREACHRLLLLALSKPGLYVADVGVNTCTVALVKP